MHGVMILVLTGFIFLLKIENVQCTSESIQHQVYTQTYSDNEFVFSRGIPAMTELTICMWLKVNGGTSSGESILSYAVEEADNEFLFFIDGSRSLRVYINGEDLYLDTFVDADVDPQLTSWKRHCWTWKCGSKFKWYTTMYDDSTMLLYASVDHGNHTVRGGGGLVLMHDQDSLLGGMSKSDGLEGDVANFRMWNYELDFTQINALTCLDDGNVISQRYMNYTFVNSTTQLSVEEFPCENYRYIEEMDRIVGGMKSTMRMCLVKGAKLLNQASMTFTARSRLNCLSECSLRSDCKSINYNIVDRTCDINAEAATSYKAVYDFDNHLTSDYLYASTTMC